MKDYFLRFADETEAKSVMKDFIYTDEDGEHWMLGGHQYALWPVQEIPGKDGWHINLRVIDPELDVLALEQYSVNPKQPVCVWA